MRNINNLFYIFEIEIKKICLEEFDRIIKFWNNIISVFYYFLLIINYFYYYSDLRYF